MWILIHTLQFLVFIGQWKINYPDPVKAIFSQLGKITFGEYLDGIKIVTSSTQGLEFPPCTDDCLIDDLGLTDIKSSAVVTELGFTNLILIAICLFAILLVVFIRIITKGITCSQKC